MGPMPWQDFVVGFQIASEALDSLPTDQSPSQTPKTPSSEGPDPRMTRAERDPVLRVMLRTKEHFGASYAHHSTFMYRFWALMHLLRRGHLQQWVTTNDSNNFQSFHPAVLLAAAEVKLTNTAKFPVNRFLAHVKTILEEELDDD